MSNPKQLFIFLALLTVAILPSLCYSSGRQPGQPRQAGEKDKRIADQQHKLTQIDELVLTERQRIEDWYAYNLARLQQSAEEYASRLKESDRTLWTEFIRMNRHLPFASTYFLRTARSFLDDREAHRLRAVMMDSYFLGTTRTFLMDRGTYELLTAIVSSNNQPFVLRQQASCLLPVIEQFQLKLERLQANKTAFLDQLEQWRKEQKEYVPAVRSDLKSQLTKPQRGLVNAISFGRENVLAMVDDEIVYQGSTIDNVKVVTIGRAAVEFEKNGRKWVQTIGQIPPPAWMN